MGIKNAILRVADKAGNAVAGVSALSSAQLADINKRRESYLSQRPDPSDQTASELTNRLLAAAAVEIQGAYLAQLRDLYQPIDPSIEYQGGFDDSHNIRFMNITKWVVDPDEDSLEKLVNVYDVLADEDCSIALVFARTSSETSAYLAVANASNAGDNVDADNFARRLVDAVRGNFPGSELDGPERGVPSCLRERKPLSVAAVSNIPAEKSERFAAQTIEKLLDGVVPEKPSEDYAIVLLASPVHDIGERKLRLAELQSALTPYASWTTNYTYHRSDSIGSSATIGVNAGVSAGSQAGNTTSQASNISETDSSNEATAESKTSGLTDTSSSAESITDTDTQGTNTSGQIGISAGGEGPLGHVEVSGSLTKGSSHSSASAVGKVSSTSQAISNSLGKTVTSGIGKAISTGSSVTSGVSKAVNLGANIGGSFARSSTVTATLGADEGITQTFKNRSIEHAIEILEAQMKRFDLASALGMWDFATYVLSEGHNVASNVAHTYLALTQGKDSFASQAAINLWRGDLGENSSDAQAILDYLRNLRHPTFALSPVLLDRHPSFAVYPATVTATTALSGKELAYSLNFPKKSVPGLPVIECAAFGRNVSTFEGSQPAAGLKLGKVFHMHHEESLPVFLSKDSLTSHVFVTGSTGAGKTNTVCRILEQAAEQNVKFLVVEPAKGEYKNTFGGREDVKVFGTNPAITPLLRINPFSFPGGIHVLEHLDRLVEIFNVCWPMYAAMPAVLKDAIQLSYEDCGWNLTTSQNRFGDGLYPCLADVARNVRAILDSSEYDAENKGAYKGSLLTRLNSLTNGLNGMILSDDEIRDEDLFDENAIVDLSRVGSMETKSLLMGLIVLKLQEHRMATSHGANQPLRHLTVLEEAHNLLKRSSPERSGESGNLLGKSVEMISNAIAEMRTYGEGFVIADQAPGLLDMAAIRNTNTKIIHRLPDLSDRELAGFAANLNERQVIEVARLPRGVAAVYQNDWVEPVLCKVSAAEKGMPFCYSPASGLSGSGASVSLQIAELLAQGGDVVDQNHLQDLKELLSKTNVGAYAKVQALRYASDPPVEPRMTELAPIMTALFPEVDAAVNLELRRTEDVRRWTAAAEAALRDFVSERIDDTVRRIIIQGVLTDSLYLRMHDEKAFSDWYRNGGLS